MDSNVNETINESQTDEQQLEQSTKEVSISDKIDFLKAQVINQSEMINKSNKRFHIIVIVLLLVIIGLVLHNIHISNCIDNQVNTRIPSSIMNEAYKPVIYLYPEESTNVDVYLTCDDMTIMWPKANMVDEYEYHWNVDANPDGTLYQDNYEYSYIFWEGKSDFNPTFERGFCVSGEETGEFLRIVLNEMGLTPAEYNEFIVYWLPQMENNKYNLISFTGIDTTDEYNQAYPLYVVDENGNEPDCMMRVFMNWKAVDEPIEIEPQTFTTLERHGFTVIEWGGAEVKE